MEAGNHKNEHLSPGTQLSLPFWLAKVLYAENCVDVELPAVYGINWCSNMSVEPKVVQLGEQAPHWYEVGAKFARLLSDESERDRLVKNLLHAFSNRYVDIFRHAQNWRGEDMTELSKLYSDMERRLFDKEYAACTEMEQWKDCPVAKLTASPLARLDEPAPLAIGIGSGAEPTAKRLKQ